MFEIFYFTLTARMVEFNSLFEEYTETTLNLFA